MEDKALDKIDIASELKTLSPIEARSLELLQEAKVVEISDKVTYGQAKKLRKSLISHRTATKDLRLTFTRKLDNLKDQFIKKQDAVLEPSIEGESLVKEKIAEWEKLEEERKLAEQKRMEEIISKFDIKKLDRQTATPDDIKRERARIRMERSLLEVNDRNKAAVKNAVSEYGVYLQETEEFILERIEQEKVAAEQKAEQERLDAERKKLEEEKLAIGGDPEGYISDAHKVIDAKEQELNTDTERGSNVVPEPPKSKVAEAMEEMGVDMGAPEGDRSFQQLVSNQVSNIVAQTDELVIEMLARNGLTIDVRNIEGSRKEIQDMGYDLIKETDSAFGEGVSTHTYKLVKIIDQVRIEIDSAIKFEGEE